MPLAPPAGLQASTTGTIAHYAALWDQKFPGKGLGQAYTNYANAHTNVTPYQAAQAFGLILATGGIAKAIAAGATGLGQFNQAAVNASPALDVFHGLNLGAWFVRIGEIILGVVLVGVGVAKLTGASNLISSAVKAKI